MQVLSGLRCVDWVIGLSDDTPAALIKQVKPDVLARGGIGKPETIPGARYVMNYGGEVRVIPDKSITAADVIGNIPVR